ncbi:SDR family oxidoreductase [Streptantibioticus silvisoli]|uniref:SDR family oxidoreductase n=1 Tax=Streptantibioticus silvisoli TaxID=2705255 RepID=A0ABT6W991_9ACTN|nr:SDR family oxidoreductase [Streptantibioticus silvisoli]MDI5967331.1 SDR family oxidoreductase [Streptantibioticus silvisoli]
MNGEAAAGDAPAWSGGGPLSRLEGKVALVTGAGRGVGLAVARKLCASGCRVVLNHRGTPADAEPLLRLFDGLAGTAEAVRADVRRPRETVAALREVADRHGRLDLLVHNAGTWHPMPATAARPGALREDMSLALAPLLTAAPLLPELMPDGGRVVAVSSSGARAVVPGGYVSAGLAKAALEALVRYLAAELAGRGIAVNAVSTAKIDKGPDTVDAQLRQVLTRRTPGGRLTVPQDVADAVALLCTDEAGWIHGQTLVVDGGMSLLA